MGLVITRHPPIKGRVHELVGTVMDIQLTNAEEVVNGESKGELGEILIRCNNILYIRESS
jgi:small nuclear ribonucleoprotein (snRNP)-like protein